MIHSIDRPLRRRAMRRLHVFVLAGLSAVASAHAQTTYSITDLGVLPGNVSSAASGINDRGDVVGACGSAAYMSTGFLLRDGVMTSIGKLPSGSNSSALSVNSWGWAVGAADSTTPESQAVLFRNNTLINIAPNASSMIFAFFISDAGVIVGDMFKGGGTGAWVPQIWVEEASKPGRFRATNLNPFSGDTSAYANAANQSIQVVGSTSAQFTGTRGVFWNNDDKHTPVILQPVPGDMQSVAYAVNGLGVSAGYSWYGIYHSAPVVWSSDASHTPSALPLLAGDDHGFANGINNSGQVIGYSGVDVAGQGVTPVVWISGQVFPLQSMLDASGTGWQLRTVSAINNLGQIVGSGIHNGQTRAFILRPN